VNAFSSMITSEGFKSNAFLQEDPKAIMNMMIKNLYINMILKGQV
jgi:hypothetical protein